MLVIDGGIAPVIFCFLFHPVVDGLAQFHEKPNQDAVVAGDTVLDVESCLAVKLEIVVAGVAGGVVDDQALLEIGRAAAIGHEIVRRVVGRDIFGQEAAAIGADLDADAVNLVAVEGRTARVIGQRLRKRVRICTVVIIRKRTGSGRLGRRLGILDAAAVARDIGLPFARGARGRRSGGRQARSCRAAGPPPSARRRRPASR